MSDHQPATSVLPEGNRWFGAFEVLPGTSLAWKVGPLAFSVHRARGEWRLFTEPAGDIYDAGLDLSRRDEADMEPVDSGVRRFLVSDDSPRLVVDVLLPDRPIVSRPVTPVSIPPGETVRFYVSYPVWVSLAVGPLARKLTEFPSHRLSDTWFGPNTQVGTLCYATRSRCRLDLAEYPHIPNRANTALLIRNHASDTLHMEKLQLPVGTLGLYRSLRDGWLWTEGVTLVRAENGDMAALQLGAGPPEEAGEAERVAEPRERPQRNVVFRAFSALF